MRKSNILTCCVTICLLFAIPENRGAKLLDSLNCFRLITKGYINCTWSENNVSGKLVNMTFSMNFTKIESYKILCQEKIMISSSLMNSTWTCHMPWDILTDSDIISLSFMPERKLETRLNIVEERDEAKPQNLNCSDTDGNITCSWQVRKEIAESIDFDLFYDNGEKKCQPKCQQEISEYLSCHCNIMTDGHLNTSALLKNILVKPRESYHDYKLCLIFKLPPRNLTVIETKKGEVFTATFKNTAWEKDTFKYHYELCYWNHRDLKMDKVPDSCTGKSKEIRSNQDPSVIFELGEELEPSSNYSLMVRVQLRDPGAETYCYRGPWSQWSNMETMTTKAVPNLILLYILIPICVIALVMFAFCGYRALVRYTKQWDERIPNPNKSTIIKALQKTKTSIVLSNGLCLPYEEHLYVEPLNNIAMWTSSASKESPHVYQNQEHISRLDTELIPEEDNECFILCDLTKKYPTASIVDEYKPFTDLTNEQENKDIKDSQFTFSAFDGPYLFSESNLS